MKNIVMYIQIVLAVLIVVTVLLQQKGSGLSGAIGGGSSMEYGTKRGAEKIIFYATIVLATIWIVISVARLVVFS